MLVGLIDLGINNLTSVHKAFSVPLTNSDSMITIDRMFKVSRPDLIILPGLGKFGPGIDALDERMLTDKLKTWHQSGTKIVGICLGMQLLGVQSEESPDKEGLGLIEASIKSLPRNQKEKVPHIGWNEAIPEFGNVAFPSLSYSGDFYFVHSYQVIPSHEANILTRTPFGDAKFVSSIISENVLGFQFHPEKSGLKGKILISEIVNWARNED